MSRATQNGSVLIIAMVLLLVMTLIGMAGIEVTGLEERMVLNMRDRQAASQAAEAALVQAEEYLESDAIRIVNFADQNGSNGLYEFGSDGCNADITGVVSEKDWDEGCYKFYTSGADAFSQLVDSDREDTPYTIRYIIEELNAPPISDSLSLGSGDREEDHVYYRVTAMAKGLTETTEVRLQTVYKVKR